MRAAILAVISCALACTLAFAQNPAMVAAQHGNGGTTADPQFGQRRNETDPADRRMEREQEKQRNKQRQATLQRDTDKLLALATELKQYVDKTNENVLSLEVMKKAEEIEKLARQVKEKMRNTQ